MGGSLYTKRFELFLPSDLETPAVGTGSHVWCHSTCTRGSGGGGRAAEHTVTSACSRPTWPGHCTTREHVFTMVFG